MPYPLPSYAASIWIAGDDLMIAFPGQGPESKGHTIKLPSSETGLKTALKIMRARSHAEDLRLANKGTPSQWEAEQDMKYASWLKAMKKTKAADAEEKAEAEAFLAELGL